jgi:integrase
MERICLTSPWQRGEGVPLLVIQRQLGHADLAITSVYLRGIDNTEIVHAVHERPAPMIPASHGL